MEKFPEQPAARPIQIMIKQITIESSKPDTPTTTPPCKKRTAPKMLIMIETTTWFSKSFKYSIEALMS